MRMLNKRVVSAFTAIAIGLVAASCGGNADDLVEQATEALNDLSESGDSDAGSSGSNATGSDDSGQSSGDEDDAAVAEPEFRMPLTGAPLESADEIPNRPALAVKMPNNPQALPQTGLNEADVVFEEIINDGITRFAAVFHSQGSDPVGPIRSGRAQDVDILSNLNSPLFAWSGGNPGVTRVINNSTLTSLSYVGGYGNSYYRRDGRGGAPHNLFSSTDTLWELAPDEFAIPPQIFPYMLPGEVAEGDTASIIEIELDSILARWDYDAASGRYLRSEYGEPHMSELTGQVSADNVVVLLVEYRQSTIDAKSPEAVTVGSGQALIFTDGVVRTGVWQRSSNTDTWNLYTDETLSEPLGLSEGRTWVELPRNNPENVRYVS
ncbi:MAG: DUF3048 domain-containing protein [Actinobacteria bacterium]|nr:DUF3048 domain-containing protein [Actinomycetota bacterium]